VRNGAVQTFYVHPTDFGIAKATAAALKGDDPQANAAIITGVLDGEAGPRRDIVLLNAGAALFVGGRADSVREGIASAARAVDSGAARETLDAMVRGSKAEAVA